jgi:hypothetical protein
MVPPSYVTLERGMDLVSWYRTCAERPATSDELRQMLEEYRRGRRRAAQMSRLATTERVAVINTRTRREHTRTS